MITLVEALDFRCLQYVSRPMGGFHVLVGPNASGKTTFLDAVALLGDLVSGGIEKAVEERTANFQDLTWRREGDGIELAVEVRIPGELRSKLHDPKPDTMRYEMALGLDPESQEIRIRAETATLLAYLPDLSGIYLIEEPENGVHPRAVETMFQSLSSVYGAQILLATHSPVILSLVKPEQLLCFAKTTDGATDIVGGNVPAPEQVENLAKKLPD